MLRIFIAHAKEDEAVATRLYSQLKAKGYEPWLDKKDLLGGQNWTEEIPKAIKNSQIFIACLSNKSVAKEGYVQKEFRIALDTCASKPPDSIYLIPLRIDNCEIPDLSLGQYGVKLRDYHCVDLFEKDGFERLLKSLNQRQKSLNQVVSTGPAPVRQTSFPITPPVGAPPPSSTYLSGPPLGPATIKKQALPAKKNL